MTLRNFSSTAAQTTLSAGVTAASTTLTVAATTGFPPPPFILAVNAGASAQELVLVTAVAGNNLTVTRGYDSTVASAHDAGAVIQHSHAALDFREANTHVNATTGVHGLAGGLVGTSDTQTLTGKTLALGSNTVSGTKAQFNAALTDDDFATLAGTETLTNKTLTAPAMAAPVATGSLVGFGGAWTAWTPTISASSGAFTTVSGSGRYEQRGKTVHWSATVTMTTAGTAAGYLQLTLPVAAASAAGPVGTGHTLSPAPAIFSQVFRASTTLARVSTVADASVIGSGYVAHLSGTYEAA